MHPRTPTAALIWELWRNHRVQFFWGIAFSTMFLPGIILFCLSWEPTKANAVSSFEMVIPFMFLAIIGVSLPLSLCGAMTNARTAYAPLAIAFLRPIGTAHFALISVVFAGTNAVVSYLIPALVFRWLHLMYFPLVAGSVLAMVISVGIIVVTWSFRSIFGAMTAGCILGTVLFTPFIINSDILSGETHGWISYANLCLISNGYALLGLLALPPMILFLMYMLDRQRTGEPINPFLYFVRIAVKMKQRWFPADRASMEPFATEQAAQRWYYRRKAIFPLVAIWTICLVVVLLITGGVVLMGTISEEERGALAFPCFVFFYFLLAAQLFGFIIAVIMANMQVHPGSSLMPTTITYSTFEFALPVQDSQLTWMRLRLLFEAVMAMFGMAMLGGLLWSALFGFLPAWVNTVAMAVSGGPVPYSMYLLLLGVLLPIAVSFWVGITAMMLAVPYLSVKHEKLFSALSVLPILFFALWVLDAPWHRFAWVWPALRIAIAAGLGMLACSIVYRAHRWGVLWRRCMLSLFVVWIVFVLFCGLVLPEPAKTSGDGPFEIGSYIVLLCAVGGVVFTGPALAPLVLAMKRHQ